jgi:hypothetical protein
MAEFKVIMHGAFTAASEPDNEASGLGPSGISGFFATRIVKADNAGEAGVRAKEVILSELYETVLRGRTDLSVRLDVDECRKMKLFSSHLPNNGFTFY